MMNDMMMIFGLFLSIFFIKQSLKWFFMLDFFESIFINYINNPRLICILFCMLQNRNQGKNKSKKQKKLYEIIWSCYFDSLSACPYNTDSITNTEKHCCNNPKKSEIKERIIFFESEISYDKILKFKAHIPAQQHNHAYQDNKQAFEEMTIKKPDRMRHIIYWRNLDQW